jgi:RimJ/RimL family protein N-acetyltransferase
VKKIGKKMISMLCMLASIVSSKTSAGRLNKNVIIPTAAATMALPKIIATTALLPSQKKYEDILKEAQKEHILSGYATKKIKNESGNVIKEVITGKIEFVPIEEKHHDDWMRIMDCSNKQGCDYLKWWTSEDYLNNKSMEDSFAYRLKFSKVNNNEAYPKCICFMIKFHELDEPKTKDEFKNQKPKFKDSKIVGHIALSSFKYNLDDKKPNCFFVSYVVDKNCQSKGIATKALSLITKFGTRLHQTGLVPFKSHIMYIADENLSSQAVAKKCGFKNVGRSDKKRSNNLDAHIWVKEDDSNRTLNYLLKGERGKAILNELNKQKSEIVLAKPKTNNKSKIKLIDFNEWLQNSNKEEFKNFEEFEKIKNSVESLTKDEDVVVHMKHSEWPVAWLTDGKFYPAIPDDLTVETIKKIAHKLVGLKCGCS